MSLTRQFGMGLLFVLVLVFIGTVWINVNSTRAYVSEQLASHAQDTATSLGLSISPYVGMDGDLPIIDTMVNAIFDRGYYESIELTDVDGNVLLEKSNPAKPDMVPDWFMQLFPIAPPVTKTEINSGWTIAGELTVKSNPGLGYAQLWANAKRTFQLTLILFVVGVLLLMVLLRMITKPVVAVMLAAERIASRDFNPITYEPKTKELNLLVKAFNKMAGILFKQHSELTAQAKSYYQKAYVDPLTNIGNKQAFDNRLARIFTDTEEPPFGYLILIRLASLAHVNDTEGAAIADTYIKSISDLLFEYRHDNSGDVYRTRGAEFAIVAENITEDDCINLLKQLAEQISAHSLPIYVNGCAHIGAAFFGPDHDKANVLESADAALTAAKNAPEGWQLASNECLQKSHQSWREELQRITETLAIDIFLQPVKNFDGDILVTECLARFKDKTGENYLPTAQLIPESEKLQVTGELDKAILEKILTLLDERSGFGAGMSLAINFSSASLANTKIIDDLLQKLAKVRAKADNVVIEIHEQTLNRSFKNCIYFAAKLREIGCKITVERLGSSMAAFTHLRQIRPDYIKIDGSFTRHINESDDNQFFVSTIVSIAHGLNIEVIAELVEDAEEAQSLQGLFVDYVQGYHLGKPEAWPKP